MKALEKNVQISCAGNGFPCDIPIRKKENKLSAWIIDKLTLAVS